MLAALQLATMQAGSGAICAEIPGIDRMRVAIPDAELGAHAVTVSEVGSRLAPNEALAEVERHWRVQHTDLVLRAEAGEWSVLSRRLAPASSAESSGENRLAGEAFETLQLRKAPNGGSEGLLTSWHPRQLQSIDVVSLAHLLPDDARVVRQLASRDAGERPAQTLLAHLERTLEDSESHIDRHLRLRGFAAMRAPMRHDELRWRDDRARFYGSTNAELLVTLHRQPRGTDVVLHHVGLPR